ncbi:MAG: hypothetical protein HWE11_14055, partial [Gammaproteobacteria bacterium]|nr:hypothetical protein [Gammaproteobacteria bacterium]
SRQLSSNKPIKAEEKTAETLTTHIQINELQKELIKLGYLIPPDYIAAYASYSEDTLLHMADYGDMVAIHTLKQRYLAAEQLDAYRSMQEEAVLQGSIADISELHDVEFAKYASDDSREGLLKSAAYAELAGLRGSSVTVNYAISNFNENGVEFSSSELKQINLMAQEMLEQINLKRRDKGKAALEKIDDSQLISFAPNQSHSGWGVEYVSAQLD